MKWYSEYWEFQSFPTFIKASPSLKNRYQQGFRIYASADAFLADFGDDEQAVICATHFNENKKGKARSVTKRKVVDRRGID